MRNELDVNLKKTFKKCLFFSLTICWTPDDGRNDDFDIRVHQSAEVKNTNLKKYEGKYVVTSGVSERMALGYYNSYDLLFRLFSHVWIPSYFDFFSTRSVCVCVSYSRLGAHSFFHARLSFDDEESPRRRAGEQMEWRGWPRGKSRYCQKG